MSTYPASFYKDPSLGGAQELSHLEWKKKAKTERKQYRAKSGCGGCVHSQPMMGLYACNLGETPGKMGYCGKWHDIRSNKKPSEI